MARFSLASLLTVAMLTAAACGDSTSPGPAPADSTAPFTDTTYLQVVHTAAGVPAIDVRVGQRLVIAGLALGRSSDFVAVPAGRQPVEFRAQGATAGTHGTTLSLGVADSTTVFTIDSSTVLNPWVLTDSGAVVPPTASKLRVVHFAGAAPAIDVWRTQPDFPSLITVQFPFRYREVSPYLQSDPGIWTVRVTTEQRDATGIPALGDSLAATGDIMIPAGESRTVVVTDREGGGVSVTVIVP